MFILRPSSPFKRAETPPLKIEAKPSETVQPLPDEPYIDQGLPIPDSYDFDIIRALLQDPFRIFIYWEVREESLKSLTRLFSPEEAATFRVVLKLRDVDGGQEAYFDVGTQGRYWMMVFPNREYEFEIGMRSPRYGYIMLIRSNRVRTPRGTVAPEPATEGKYSMTPPEFVDIIEASGFSAEQSLSLTIAAANGVVHEQEMLEATINRLPASVKEAMQVAAEGGALTAEMIDRMPEPLRTELMKLLIGSDGNIASVGLMHYLPEMLREVMEDDSEFVGDAIHPVHVAPRFFTAGTENLQWPAHELRWPGLPRKPGPHERLARPGDVSGAGRRPRRTEGRRQEAGVRSQKSE
ncbi:MAG TPA: DUF4912 domain-containing protein [Blastocatellia bacterium]|nr:DUF4912 domain-containing protein [Blastocatellia bacterium]